MGTKLIKVLEHYHLYDGDKAIATTIVGNPMLLPNLSLKNCEEIERGYDLYELVLYDLVLKEYPNHGSTDNIYKRVGFCNGFQKALEVNSDKRFTFKEMVDCWNKALNFQEHKETLGDYMQSLQQTEWDVEIVMGDPIGIGDKYTPDTKPKLDEDGCLILKRI